MTNCYPAGTRPVKNIEKMCVSPDDGRMTGDGSPSKSDGNFIVEGGKKIKLSAP